MNHLLYILSLNDHVILDLGPTVCANFKFPARLRHWTSGPICEVVLGRYPSLTILEFHGPTPTVAHTKYTGSYQERHRIKFRK